MKNTSRRRRGQIDNFPLSPLFPCIFSLNWEIFQNHSCGMKGPGMYIRPWALFENIQLSKDSQTLTKMYKSVSYGRILVIEVWENSPRRNVSPTKQSRGQRFNMPSRTTRRTILLVRISIKKEQDKGKLRNIQEKAATTTLNTLQLTPWPH